MTFPNEEFANVMYMYGFHDGKAQAVVEEYRWGFPDHKVADR
jgi:hypothetical protein